MSDTKQARETLVKAGLRVATGAACGELGTGHSRVRVEYQPMMTEPWSVLVGDPPGPSIIGRGVSMEAAIADARGVAQMVLEHDANNRSKAAIERAHAAYEVWMAALREVAGE